MSVMLYKTPGPHKLHGIMCEYTVVEEGDVDARLKEGWAKSPAEADNPKRGRPAKKTEAEDE